jgi:hypothetical protein
VAVPFKKKLTWAAAFIIVQPARGYNRKQQKIPDWSVRAFSF